MTTFHAGDLVALKMHPTSRFVTVLRVTDSGRVVVRGEGGRRLRLLRHQLFLIRPALRRR